VILDEPTDYTKVATQVETGNVQYDIVDGDPYVMDPACGTEWEPLDVDARAVDPELETNSECTVPDYQYFYVIGYDEEAFGEDGPKTCEDFFNTEEFPGKRAVWSYYVSAVVECAAIAAGGDPQEPYPVDIDAAFTELESIKDELVVYDSSATAVDQMQNQDVAMGIYSARMMSEATSNGAPFVASDEWFMRAVGSFGIPKGAPNADAANALLDYLMQKDVNAQWLADATGGVGNVTDPVEVKDPEDVIPDDLESGPLMDWEWWAENDPEVSERFNAVATG
jgi:putative spermidine/putrescine transport system substrate-binding protein